MKAIAGIKAIIFFLSIVRKMNALQGGIVNSRMINGLVTLKSRYSTKGAGTVTARHISKRKSGMSIKGMDWKRSIRQRLLALMR